jgi:hypothetical protein
LALVRFERSVKIAAPRERVFAELSEPARFLGLQPLLASVREVPGVHGARCFEAVERVPIAAGWTLPSRLRVELHPDAAGTRVAFRTRAPLGIRLTGAFELADAGGDTLVRESVELRCAQLLAGFVAPQAIHAQEALLANLKRRLEADAPA